MSSHLRYHKQGVEVPAHTVVISLLLILLHSEPNLQNVPDAKRYKLAIQIKTSSAHDQLGDFLIRLYIILLVFGSIAPCRPLERMHL